MSDASLKVMEIFWDALDCATPAEQTAYLERACGGDTVLRDRVEARLGAHRAIRDCMEALVGAHRRAGHFLQGLPAPADRAATDAPEERQKEKAEATGEPTRPPPRTMITP
jgi:hypothetical protein